MIQSRCCLFYETGRDSNRHRPTKIFSAGASEKRKASQCIIIVKSRSRRWSIIRPDVLFTGRFQMSVRLCLSASQKVHLLTGELSIGVNLHRSHLNPFPKPSQSAVSGSGQGIMAEANSGLNQIKSYNRVWYPVWAEIPITGTWYQYDFIIGIGKKSREGCVSVWGISWLSVSYRWN